MSLRKITLILVAVTTVGLIAILLLSMNRILTPHFEEQQKVTLQINLQRVNGAINREFTFLLSTSRDWAKWDDTYDFVQTGSPEYVEANLREVTLVDLALDLMIFLDLDGNIVNASALSANRVRQEAIPAEVMAHLQPGDLLLAQADDLKPRQGFLDVGGVPLLIVSHPILTTGGNGPAAGTLILGRYMNQFVAETISNFTFTSLEILPVEQVAPGSVFAAAKTHLLAGESFYFSQPDDETIHGFILLNDFFGEPAFILRGEQFSTIYRSGMLVRNYMLISVIMSGVTFAAILFMLFEVSVLSRLRKLSREVIQIGRSGDISRRLQVNQRDELAALGSTINDMLTELQAALAQKQQSEDRFRSLVESMEDLVFTRGRDTDRMEFFGKPAADGQHPLIQQMNSLLDIPATLAGSAPGEQVLPGNPQFFEWSVGQENGARHYNTSVSPIQSRDGSVTGIVGVARDITPLKEMEQVLRKRVAELGALHEASQGLIGQTHMVTAQETICRLAVEQFGMAAAWIGSTSLDENFLEPVAAFGCELAGLPKLDLNFDPDTPAALPLRALQTGQVQVQPDPDPQGQTGPAPANGPSAVSIPLVTRGQSLAVLTLLAPPDAPVEPETLRLLQAFANLCIISLQSAYLFSQVLAGRERLQTLSRRLVEVQEEERRTIALELHDEIGQILTGLKLTVELIPRLAPDEIGGHVSKIKTVVNDLIARVRQISLDLRPSMLDDLGIIPTLLWHIDQYQDQTQIQVAFQHTNLQGRRFNPELEITVYRIVQEGLTNIARHAGVDQASVRIWCSETVLGVQIEDGGKGFILDDNLSARQSRGLIGIRERVGFLGGRLSIITSPGEGTTLNIEIPLQGKLERRSHARNHTAGG